MLSPNQGQRQSGSSLATGELERSRFAQERLGSRFKNAMGRGVEGREQQEAQERARHNRASEGIQRQNLDMQRSLMSQWDVVQDAFGRAWLMDKRVPQGQPPRLVPFGPGHPGGPAAGGAGQQIPPNVLSPPPAPGGERTGPPAAPPPAAAGPSLREPSEGEMAMGAMRKKLPEGVQKELNTLDTATNTLQRAHAAVQGLPDAFGPGTEIAEWVPGMAPSRAVGSYQAAKRSPEATKARALVFEYAYKVVHDLAGAQTTAYEQNRVAAFAPAPNDTPEAILAKLEQAYEVADQTRGERYRTYMPLLNVPPGAPLGPRPGAQPGPAARPPPARAGAAPGQPARPGGPPVGTITRSKSGRPVRMTPQGWEYLDGQPSPR
jgi:hypothetical protein